MSKNLWKAEPDPDNNGYWRIINTKTMKAVVNGVSKQYAEEQSKRRNKKFGACFHEGKGRV